MDTFCVQKVSYPTILCHLRETKRQIKLCWIHFLNSYANCIFETPDWTMIYIDNSTHFKARKISSLISKDPIITPIKTVQALKHEIWLLTHLLSLLPAQSHDNVSSNFSERFISTRLKTSHSLQKRISHYPFRIERTLLMAFNVSASGHKFVYAFGNQNYHSDIFLAFGKLHRTQLFIELYTTLKIHM